jgi:pimeloyl-ACP methyl ester carboxylesterase/DNA-binding CsgD family transcriptional regulator
MGPIAPSGKQGMTAFSQNRNFSRISGETLTLLEEAADQFADDATLVAAIGIWDDRLTEAAKRMIGSAADGAAWEPLFDYEIMSVVPEAEEGVIGLLKFAQRRRAIMEMASPAFVIDHRAKVLIANEAACALLALTDGSAFPGSLVDPAFAKTFRDLTEACASPQAPARTAILRLGKADSAQFLFEARAKPDGEGGIIVFRKIGIGLTDIGARFLADAFELTDSEVGVIRLLMEGLHAKEMAARRKTAEATIRTQLKSIFLKTGTSGQTELMRIVSGISLFQAAKTADREGLIFRNVRIDAAEGRLVGLPNGQFVQVNESGAADGRPFLSLHGLFLGYAFPKIAEDLLVSNGLKRFGLMRPGFGRSTPVTPGTPLGEIVDCFADVMDALGIGKCPVVAHGFGGAHAFAFANRHPDRVSALIMIGAFLPASNMASVIRMSGFQRALMFAAQHSPAMFSFFSRTAERVLERDGIIEFLRRYLGSSKADIDILSRHETESSIRMRLNLAQAQQIETYRQECILQISDLSAYARHPGVPVIIVHGTQDPVFPVALVHKAAAALKADQFHELADCGQMILYARPEVAIEAIAQFA